MGAVKREVVERTYDAGNVEMGEDKLHEKKQKLRYSLIPANVLEMLAKVFQYGAVRYGSDNGWQMLDPQLYEDALFRHLQEIRKGNRFDESGLPHWSHVFCNAAICLWHDLKANGDG